MGFTKGYCQEEGSLGFQPGKIGKQGSELAQRHITLVFEKVCHMGHMPCPLGAGESIQEILYKDNITDSIGFVKEDGM